MPNVLIASTYHESDKPIKPAYASLQQQIPNKVWLDLQLDFIHRNTQFFNFAVYLNTITNKNMFRDCVIIGENDKTIEDPRSSHRFALRETINYFRQHKNSYDAFCILDSDAFPIKPHWVEDILGILKERNLKFAAIVRFENGEDFPHPAGMVIPKEHIDEDLYQFPEDYEEFAINVINGDDIFDTGVAMSFWQDSKLIGHPLLRSNVINFHPLYAGIYGDFFYHHGLGSRVRKLKAHDTAVEPVVSYKTKPYWHIHGNFYKDIWVFFDLLIKQPQKFINMLRGKGISPKELFNYINQPLKSEFPPFDP